jgi:hypothetical protein
MSDNKEVDISFKIGDFVENGCGHKGSFKIESGPTATNKILAELQGKYGEDYDNKPVIVIPSEDAEELKDFIENFKGLTVMGDEEKEQFQQAKEAFIKPTARRVGDEVVLSRQDPVDEIAPFVGGFQDVLDGSVSLEFKLSANKTVHELIEARKNMLYMMMNGASGSLNVKMSLAFMERAFDMGTQFAPVPEPELAKSMLNFFKSYKLNFETVDVESLPTELKEVFAHPMIDQICNPFQVHILALIGSYLLPIMNDTQLFAKINGPIRIYFPIRDTLVVTAEAHSVNWFETVYALLKENKAEVEAMEVNDS